MNLNWTLLSICSDIAQFDPQYCSKLLSLLKVKPIVSLSPIQKVKLADSELPLEDLSLILSPIGTDGFQSSPLSHYAVNSCSPGLIGNLGDVSERLDFSSHDPGIDDDITRLSFFLDESLVISNPDLNSGIEKSLPPNLVQLSKLPLFPRSKNNPSTPMSLPLRSSLTEPQQSLDSINYNIDAKISQLCSQIVPLSPIICIGYSNLDHIRKDLLYFLQRIMAWPFALRDSYRNSSFMEGHILIVCSKEDVEVWASVARRVFSWKLLLYTGSSVQKRKQSHHLHSLAQFDVIITTIDVLKSKEVKIHEKNYEEKKKGRMNVAMEASNNNGIQECQWVSAKRSFEDPPNMDLCQLHLLKWKTCILDASLSALLCGCSSLNSMMSNVPESRRPKNHWYSASENLKIQALKRLQCNHLFVFCPDILFSSTVTIADPLSSNRNRGTEIIGNEIGHEYRNDSHLHHHNNRVMNKKKRKREEVVPISSTAAWNLDSVSLDGGGKKSMIIRQIYRTLGEEVPHESPLLSYWEFPRHYC